MTAAQPTPADRVAVGAILIGATAPTEWRPADEDLAVLLDAAAEVVAGAPGELPSIRAVCELARAIEPGRPWPAIVGALVDEWDAVATALPRAALARDAGELLARAIAELDAAVDDLLAARARAQRALADVRRITALGDEVARVLARRSDRADAEDVAA